MGACRREQRLISIPQRAPNHHLTDDEGGAETFEVNPATNRPKLAATAFAGRRLSLPHEGLRLERLFF